MSISQRIAAPDDTPPPAITSVAPDVVARLEVVLADERDRLVAVDPTLVPLADAVASLVLGGGKRLRPAFCHWGFVLAGGDPDDAPLLVDTCAALELLHGFALIHDDVMDGSSTRRGRDAAHVHFANLHEAADWRGEPRRFGEGMAIVAGDYAAVLADRMIDPAPAHVRAVWTELQIEIAAGQFLDLLHAANADGGVEASRRIARLKSGRYTVERPLHLGVALADGPDDLVAALGRFGQPLGEAFQLRDDLLGAFGDSAETGKPVGDDLREGKPTALLAMARARADADEAAILAMVGRADLSADDIAGVRDVLRATGAADATEALIGELADEAGAALDALDGTVPAQGLDALRQLTQYVIWRAH